MQYCKIDKCPNVSTDNANNVCEKHALTESITYKELARRVGDMVLNNQIHSATPELLGEWECVNGSESYCYKHETPEECEKDDHNCDHEYTEIYQEYIIADSGADYLKRTTNEILFYNEKLDIYLWGITHYGTSWDGVTTSIKA
jgi:hypothetical protein